MLHQRPQLSVVGEASNGLEAIAQASTPGMSPEWRFLITLNEHLRPLKEARILPELLT